MNYSKVLYPEKEKKTFEEIMAICIPVENSHSDLEM